GRRRGGAERVGPAKAFAKPFALRRCLVPATGWYEFAPPSLGSKAKQPYFMTPRDGGPVVFGGLWTVWGDERLLTCSIVTTEAIGDLLSVHSRMPLVLSSDRWGSWLTAREDLDALLAPPSAADVAALEIRAVGPAVGDVRNDGPQLIEALPGSPAAGSAPLAPVEEATDLTLF